MSSVIFSGDYVKALKAGFRLKDQATIWSGTVDPSVTPTFGRQGDLYIKFGTSPAFYQKQSTGTDTSWSAASGGGGASSPYTPDDALNWNPDPTTIQLALDQLAANIYDQNYVVETITLSGTDITNKYVTLAATPITATKTRLNVIGGPEQAYGADFSVSLSQLGWNTLFLDGVLTAGDKLVIAYSK